jgi:hypothetical protein
MVETTFHPAQKFPAPGHFQSDASSSLIPEPVKINKIRRPKVKQGSGWKCDMGTKQ